MDNDPRELCKYGPLCYQTNPKHHERFKHPAKTTKKRNGEEETSDKKRPKQETEQKLTVKDGNSKTEHEESSVRRKSPSPSKFVNRMSPSPSKFKDNASEDCIQYHNFIQDKFLVTMPEDFYELWKFCKKINVNKPLEALKEAGLILVGPYDVLADRFVNVNLTDEAYLRHCRYYYDPPEFQTILANIHNGYHIGYFRDDPNSQEYIVTSNDSKSCEIIGLGDNIFTALKIYIDKYIITCNPFAKSKILKLQKILSSEYESQLNRTENMKKRQRKIVTKTFHKMGLVVPYDNKTELGYRQMIISDAELKKKLKMVSESTCPEEVEIAMSLLQPVITAANIATDECDFGTGIELGLDLFCDGTSSLHKLILSLLATGYDLVKRKNLFIIVKAHLQDRRKGNDMSVL